MTGIPLSPGFADPVRDAQAAFRALLGATARPGTIVALPEPAEPPPCLPPAMAALALTLVDAGTPLWLDAAALPAVPWLRFHCGCRIVAAAGEAAFVFATDAAAMPRLARLDPGTDDYPDRAATAVIAVAGLGSGAPLLLSGPGIDGTATLHVAGLPGWFIEERAANHRLFPRGVDVVLAASGHIAALPRSTAVTEGGR